MLVKTWTLDDAQVRGTENPYTFYIPSKELLDLLKVGDLVKLTFTNKDEESERMWVEIGSIDGKNFVGRLDNDPIYIKELKAGDRIEFESRHINNSMVEDPVPSITEKYLKRCFVTNNILYGEGKVGYIYREVPDSDDSGWRMTTGDETDEYMEDSANASYVSLGAVLRKDDSILGLLDNQVGARYRRDQKTNIFIDISHE